MSGLFPSVDKETSSEDAKYGKRKDQHDQVYIGKFHEEHAEDGDGKCKDPRSDRPADHASVMVLLGLLLFECRIVFVDDQVISGGLYGRTDLLR